MVHASLPVLLLLLSLWATQAVLAKAPSGEIKEAIEYVTRRVPESKSRHSNWVQLLPKAVAAMKEHPRYARWLLEDEAKAAAAARRSVSEQPTFNCQLERSPAPPTSVHRLRPGDIDVVGAMGDSLTAANGARATSILGLLIEYRGYAWSIGGEVSLGRHTTIPNILRKDNTKLYGYSTASGSWNSAASRLNVGQPGREARDMPGQAVALVSRMKSDRNVDFENDWKMITMFIGGNDVCDYCKDKSIRTPAKFIENVRKALDYLHANVPRAFVNVAEVLDVSLVKSLIENSRTCQVLTGGMLCKCVAQPDSKEDTEEIEKLIREYQRLLRDLVSSGRYDTRDDFTVVNQPFFRNSKPEVINGRLDLSLFAPDCFHFSQKGHNQAARALWNNMLEPVGKKSTSWDPSGTFLCPSKSQPYFMTNKNS